MTRMQAARVFAKRRAEYDDASLDALIDLARATSLEDQKMARTKFNMARASFASITALWRDLSAAWDSEEA